MEKERERARQSEREICGQKLFRSRFESSLAQLRSTEDEKTTATKTRATAMD